MNVKMEGLYLDISSFFDGINQFKLHQNVVTPEMDTRHGTNDHINLFNSIHETLVIGKRGFNEPSPLLLKGKQHLKFIDVEADLRALEDIGCVPLSQTSLDYSPADVPSSPHNKNLALSHGWISIFALLCFPSETKEVEAFYRDLVITCGSFLDIFFNVMGIVQVNPKQ